MPCRYVRVIITAERVILPQDGFDRRPEFHEFVARLTATVLEAAGERRRCKGVGFTRVRLQGLVEGLPG